MLIKSSWKWAYPLVFTSTEKAPGLLAVSVKTLPTTVSTEQRSWSPLQYWRLATRLERRSHMLKSKFLPWIILPSLFLATTPVQALMVENSYMKLRKKSLSKGQPDSLAIASTQATKSWYLNWFLANHSTSLKKVLGKGIRSKKYMNLLRGYSKSFMMGAHRTIGESQMLTLQTLGTWVMMGSGCGWTLARAAVSSRSKMI